MDQILAAARDPLWQFVGALLALGIPTGVYWLQRRKKELSVGVLTHVVLLTRREELEGHIAVTFDGAPVSDISLYEIGIRNTGTVPIGAEDFSRPLVLRFGDGATVLSAGINLEEPENLRATISHDASSISLAPLLLNAGDTVLAKALVSSAGRFSPDARIAGVSRLLPLEASSGAITTAVFCLLFCFATITAVIATAAATQHDDFVLWIGAAFVWGVVALFGYVLYLMLEVVIGTRALSSTLNKKRRERRLSP